MNFHFIADLAQTVTIPENGTLSRTVYDDEQIKAVIFAFDTGEALSEHMAAMPAIIHILEGEATITLGDERKIAQGGTWIHMDAKLPHGIYANTPLIMLLLLLKP